MSWIQTVQKNRVFRFLSSVKLAVPLMFALLTAAAAGTVYESQYNAEIATVTVYRSTWFLTLLGLLWTNIFCATVSRWPFKKHHTGFVITHIGLLTLLIGGMMTATIGVDGQLRVVQGSADNEVFLQKMVVRVDGEQGTLAKVPFSRALKPLKSEDLDSLNEAVASGFTIEEYQPFVSIERGFSGQGGDQSQWAVRFAMKSQFFNVAEWLNTRDRPEMSMGPATLRLVVDRGAVEPIDMHGKNAPEVKKAKLARAKRPAPPKKAAPSGASLVRVKEAKGDKILAEFPLSALRKGPQSIGPIKISLTRAFEEAMVAGGGKIEDKGTPGKNPALELKVEHQGQSLREIAFARFPGFSLQPQGTFGLHFEYVASGTAAEEPEAPAADSAESASDGTPPPMAQPQAPGGRMGNVIEFHAPPSGQGPIRLELYKNGEQVLKQEAKEGEPIQTPWMGMVLTLTSAVRGGQETEEIKPVELTPRTNMPPSALRVHIPGTQESAWVVEGDRRPIQTPSGMRYLYYGPESLKLPFQIQLEQFSKIDYPGTETAMSYQSLVKVNGQGDDITIKMNEPLKRAGFTLYQSSYVLDPGQPPVSIFSVNRDPGRPVKYAGSIILVAGIAVFTVMRSRWYLDRQRKAVAA